MHLVPNRTAVTLRRILLGAGLIVAVAPMVMAQAQAGASAAPGGELAAPSGSPIAMVPIDSGKPDEAATVTGALEVSRGRAIIAASGSVASGSRTTEVTLPRRGVLRVCASTTVKLAADSSVPAGEMPGLLMAMDHGAVEMSFANLRNADTLLTPYFRILVGGPGAAEVKVRLGREGDTCVDNVAASNAAPYVVVTSVFESGLYRVQPGQRVMFQHGSLREVADQEKEPCGCPPDAAETKGNEFPLAQSEGLAPGPVTNSSAKLPAGTPAASGSLIYNGGQSAPQTVVVSAPTAAHPSAEAASAAPQSSAEQKKPGLFKKIGHFFRRIFGAE